MVFKTKVKYNGVHYPAGVDVPITEAELNGEISVKEEPVKAVVEEVKEDNALDKLIVESKAGAKNGYTEISVSPTLASGNKYRLKIATEVSVPTIGQSLRLWSNWDGKSEISAMTGKEICIAEVDADYKAVRFGVAKITAKE